MRLFTRLANKKRAISPVISVILLIGLAVAAAAAIFLVVLPLLETTTNLQIDDAYVEYDDDYTTAADVGKGYGKGTLILSNPGTGEIEIVSLNVYYADSVSLTADWTEINETDKGDITTDNSYEIAPLAALEELTVRFLIPENNTDKAISYKIEITTDGGDELDTAEVANIDETEMQLKKDRPDISFIGTLGNVRRTQTISPTSVSDNSEIKNVTYEVSTDSTFSTVNRSKTITSSLWKWQWDTFNDTTEGLDNDSYYLRMTVCDYAGLSASTYPDTPINITIDNDYTPPTIGGLWITDPYPNNQTAEVGQSVSFTVEIIDTGTAGASIVDSAILYYRINGSVDTYAATAMNKFGTTNNWTTNIDPDDVDSTALENGIECYVSSEDIDGNKADSSGNLKIIPVDDHVKPDISHTSVQSANWDDLFINISSIITDEDQVNESNVKLYYRQTDDYGGKTTSWVSLPPSISGNGYSWLIWSTDISIHGLDYFFNATDRFSGRVANSGTETSPYHISIPDTLSPTIDHDAITSATEDADLVVVCRIFDEDPTFGAEGSVTGTVTLHYRDNDAGGGTVLSSVMSRISGNSSIDSNSETPEWTTWSGTIPRSWIVDDGNPSQLDYYIKAVDDSTNLVQNGNPFHYVTVIPQGDPNIEFVSNSITVSGTIGEQLYFEILNKAGSATSAKIAKLNLTILSSTADFTSDYPMLNMTQFNSTQVWSDPNPIDRNKTWITFTTNYTISEGNAAGITMTFENTSNQPYSMYDLDLILELLVYNSVQTVSTKKLTFQTPPAQVSVSDKLHMTSTYLLSTSGTTSTTSVETGWQSAFFQPSFTWGIRVFVGGNEITTQLEATYSDGGTSGAWLERQRTWNCPQTPMNPTDSVTIRVRVIIGSTPYTLAEFSTGPLGATELSNVDWTINYWVMWRVHNNGVRYMAAFGFGDTGSWDSFVDNFTYVTSG